MAKKIYETEKSFQLNISQLADMFGVDRKTVRKRLAYVGTKPSGKKSGSNVYTISDAAIAIVSFDKQTQDLVYRIHGR